MSVRTSVIVTLPTVDHPARSRDVSLHRAPSRFGDPVCGFCPGIAEIIVAGLIFVQVRRSLPARFLW